METLSYDTLVMKIDIILDQLYGNDRSHADMVSMFKTWIDLEYLSGTIDFKDYPRLKKYGLSQIDSYSF